MSKLKLQSLKLKMGSGIIFLAFLFTLSALSFKLCEAQTVTPTLNGGTQKSLLASDSNQILITKGRAPMKLLSLGSNGQVLSITGGQIEWMNGGGGGSGLINWTDSLNAASPNVTVHVVALVVNNSGTNVDAVIQAKGTGATVAQIPNNANSGGNKRGTYATDWQKNRDDPARVAAGDFSGILGGFNNRVSGSASVIAGGHDNTVAGANAFVGGGRTNSASADYTAIVSGSQNTASGLYSIIFGGQKLTLSGSYSFGMNGNMTNIASANSNVGILSNIGLWLTNSDGTARSLLFLAPSSATTIDSSAIKYTGFQSPDVITDSRIYKLPAADGSPGQFLSTDAAGNLSWASASGGGGLINWVDSLNTTSPNTTVHVVALVANNSGTNVDAAIQAKGNGATLAQIPNGAVSGGNKRGHYATDWQKDRSDDGIATDVASGDWSTISGGDDNAATGARSTIVGGSLGRAGGTASVAGGYNNFANGNYSIAIGGNRNRALGTYTAIFGGQGLTFNGSYAFGFLNYANTRFLTVDTSGVAVFGNANLWLANNNNTPSAIRFYTGYNAPGQFPNGTNYIDLRAPDSLGLSYTLKLPPADGISGQVLATDASGNLSWVTRGSGGGSVTSVALTAPSIFTVSGSPVTTAGTLDFALNTQTQNKVFASPNGSTGTPIFRALVANDIPNLDASILTAGTLPSARFPALTGDVTTSAGSVATTIAANAVTYAQMQAVSATSKLLGSSSTTTPVQELSLGAGLSLSGTTLSATGTGGTVTTVSVVTANGVSGSVANPTTTPAITLTLGAITPITIVASSTIAGSNLSGTNTGDQTITLTGNVTGSGTGSFAATIANNAVTYAKMQNTSQSSILLGRGSSAGAGAVQEITLGTGLSMVGTSITTTNDYYTWSSTSSASFAAVVQNAYTTVRSGQQTVTLPASPTDNQRVIVHGNNSGGWIISLSSQTIHFPDGSDYTTSVSATDGSIELIWNNTSSKWDYLSGCGTITGS